MRLFFEDPNGDRLALDTNRQEWAATYETEETKISDDHFIINVEAPEVLHRIEREADFNGYGYNQEIDKPERAPVTSVYAEYLQRLADFNIKAEAAGIYNDADDLDSEMDELKEKLESANETGYFNPRQYAALLLIVDDIESGIRLYHECEKEYQEAAEAVEDEPF